MLLNQLEQVSLNILDPKYFINQGLTYIINKKVKLYMLKVI